MRDRLDIRAAVIHDWFQGYHGSERVADIIRTDLFAHSAPPDVFTFVVDRDRVPGPLAEAVVRESGLARLPGFRPHDGTPGRWRYLLPLMPRYFSRLPLDDYDVVIASSHACALHARPGAHAVYVCYCHTPMRYLWLPDVESERVGNVPKAMFRIARGPLRRADVAAAQRPDSFVANSTAVRERIARFYGRDAIVIHPPVDVADFEWTADKDPGHFLWVHRLVSYKQPELVIEAFRGTSYRLTMVGVGPLEGRLRSRLPPNVELRSWMERAELASLMARACGFVHVGEEDFGMSMVEALASGTPVVALSRGGSLDIVRPDVDGVLIDRPQVELLREAIRRVAERTWNRQELADRAALFSRDRFVERLRAHVGELVEARRKA